MYGHEMRARRARSQEPPVIRKRQMANDKQMHLRTREVDCKGSVRNYPWMQVFLTTASPLIRRMLVLPFLEYVSGICFMTGRVCAVLMMMRFFNIATSH